MSREPLVIRNSGDQPMFQGIAVFLADYLSNFVADPERSYKIYLHT